MLAVTVGVLLSTTDASAGGPWDHSGGTDGRFASAIEACKDQLGTGGAYEVAQATAADSKGYSQCMVREKGNSGAPLIYNGLVYRIDGQPAPPPAKGCDATSDLSWFPSISKSRLARAASGDAGDVTPSAKPGTCAAQTDIMGPKLFANSKGKVRPDRMARSTSIPNHFHLNANGLIVDTTLFQFINVKNGFEGIVFAGTDAQLASTLDRLVKQCGTSEDPIVKSALAGKSGAELKTMLWDKATKSKGGDTIQMRRSGKGADYK